MRSTRKEYDTFTRGRREKDALDRYWTFILLCCNTSVVVQILYRVVDLVFIADVGVNFNTGCVFVWQANKILCAVTLCLSFQWGHNLLLNKLIKCFSFTCCWNKNKLSHSLTSPLWTLTNLHTSLHCQVFWAKCPHHGSGRSIRLYF